MQRCRARSRTYFAGTNVPVEERPIIEEPMWCDLRRLGAWLLRFVR